jgi:hypothetical protein
LFTAVNINKDPSHTHTSTKDNNQAISGGMKYREGVVVKSRNNADAEIISSNGDRYTVRVRGSPVAISVEDEKTEPYRFEVHKDDLSFITPELGNIYYMEQIRKHLFERHSAMSTEVESEGMDKDIGKRAMGHLLGDECGFLIWKHTNRDTLDGLPNEIEERVLALLIEQNYILGGESVISGRSLTSYSRILKPFVSIEEETVAGVRRALVKTATPPTGEALVSWFESLILAKTQTQSASLFFRAFAFGQYRCDNRSADDSLLDAFYVVFSAIQMMTGKGSSSKMRTCRVEIQNSINAAFQRHGTEFETTSEGMQNMNWGALLWCLCNLFLHLGFVVRDKVPQNQYQILLPNPYEDTISEQVNIANICMERREEHPASFYAAYQMIMDIKDFSLPSRSTSYFSNAFRVARLGKELAFKQSNTYYSFVFLLIESFWIPTSLWPNTEAITYGGIEERFDQAKALKQKCQGYTSEKYLYHGSCYKHMLKAFLKSAGIVSPSEQDSILISSIQFEPSVYCSARFKTSYYKPGGKFDRLAMRYTCSHCSNQVLTVRQCARCGRENYCNRDCQVKHWRNGHKHECRLKKSSKP